MVFKCNCSNVRGKECFSSSCNYESYTECRPKKRPRLETHAVLWCKLGCCVFSAYHLRCCLCVHVHVPQWTLSLTLLIPSADRCWEITRWSVYPHLPGDGDLLIRTITSTSPLSLERNPETDTKHTHMLGAFSRSASPTCIFFSRSLIAQIRMLPANPQQMLVLRSFTFLLRLRAFFIDKCEICHFYSPWNLRRNPSVEMSVCAIYALMYSTAFCIVSSMQELQLSFSFCAYN